MPEWVKKPRLYPHETNTVEDLGFFFTVFFALVNKGRKSNRRQKYFVIKKTKCNREKGEN